MSEPQGPSSYLERLLYAQRTVRSARFRNDQKMAIRELSEGVYELISVLVELEQKRGSLPDSGQPAGEEAS
jgi:hypothetical protein